MPTREATTIDVSGAEKNLDEVGSSIPVPADTAFESEGFSCIEAAFQLFVQYWDGAVDTSGLPLCAFFCPIFTLP